MGTVYLITDPTSTVLVVLKHLRLIVSICRNQNHSESTAYCPQIQKKIQRIQPLFVIIEKEDINLLESNVQKRF